MAIVAAAALEVACSAAVLVMVMGMVPVLVVPQVVALPEDAVGRIGVRVVVVVVAVTIAVAVALVAAVGVWRAQGVVRSTPRTPRSEYKS